MSGRVVVLGDLMVDVVARPDGPLARGSDAPARVRLHGGGSGANVAAWLAHIGHAPALVARVGDDGAGRDAVAELTAGGVEVHAAVDPDLATGLCVVLVEPDGERTFLPDRGANAALSPADLPAGLLAHGDHLHLSAYPLLEPVGPGREAARAAITTALDRGATVSVDPASSAPLRAVGAERFLTWTRGARLLFPNADEAEALTGLRDPERAAATLARRSGGEVVVTLGAAGALWSDGGRLERVTGTPVAGDSTGAGDAFAAGWLAARLAGAGVVEALTAANALGARALGVPGGRPVPS